MNAKNRFIHYFFTLVSVCALAACSDSDVPEPTPIEIIEKVSFPFATNNTLYAFTPQTGEKEKLAESNKSMMILLDTDQSTTVNDEDNNSFFDHTSLPEYAAYIVDQSVHLYDFYTRREHILTSFEALNNEGTNEYICDLRNLITVDEARLAKKEAFFKDEKAFYIKTSLNENCTGNATSFNYLRIEIADSFTETFDIRRTTLLEHTHKHTHEHEHIDDHDHEHRIEDCHTETFFNVETTVCSNNHLHNHDHEHDFLYPIMDEHLFGEDPDIVHNDPNNQSIELETHPVLVGRRHQVDEALMYSGEPIVDTNNKEFGYLGFNSAESSYKFYVIINQDLEKLELWNTTNSEFSIQPEGSVGKSRQGFSDSILLEFNWKVVNWNITELFDDDKDNEREASINTPLFQRTPEDTYTRAVYSMNLSTEKLAIKDNKSIFIVSAQETQPQIPLRTLDETNLDFFNFSLFNKKLIAYKQYTSGTENSNLSLFDNKLVAFKQYTSDAENSSLSITEIDVDTGLENTLIPLTDSAFSFIPFTNQTLAISIEDPIEDRINTIWKGDFFNPELTNVFTPSLENVTWTGISDRKATSNSTQVEPVILHSDLTQQSSNELNSVLVEPKAYLFDSDKVNGHGKLLGTVPTEVTFAYGITIHNELFANITIEEALVSPRVLKTYYFNPDDPSVEMQLMYEEVFEQ